MSDLPLTGWKLDRVMLLNETIGEYYRAGVLSVTTWALRHRMNGDSRDRWYHETLLRFGREDCPRVLYTGRDALRVEYSSGRWSWVRISKREANALRRSQP